MGETSRRGTGVGARAHRRNSVERRGAIVAIVIGLGAILAHLVLVERPTAFTNVFRCGGSILTFVALTWVVARAVYAPGRINLHRIQRAVVLT